MRRDNVTGVNATNGALSLPAALGVGIPSGLLILLTLSVVLFKSMKWCTTANSESRQVNYSLLVVLTLDPGRRTLSNTCQVRLGY